MIEEFVRPFDATERSRLEGQLRMYTGMRDRTAAVRNVPTNRTAAVLVTCALLPGALWHPWGWIATSVLLGVAVWMVVHFRRKTREDRAGTAARLDAQARGFEAALRDGHAIVRRVRASRVVRLGMDGVEEVEESLRIADATEGEVVDCFEVEDGVFFCADASDLALDEEYDTWPCDDFEFVVARAGVVQIGIRQRGDPVRTVRVVEEGRTPQTLPPTGTVLRGSFESLETVLARPTVPVSSGPPGRP